MRFLPIALAAGLVLGDAGLSHTAFAEEAPAAEVAADAVLVEEALVDETAAEGSAEPAAPVPALGPMGYDAQGRPGRIHVVVTGDTLWDISDGYLGTPWVWPSIWKDNDQVANPHLIYPGDQIWITPTEMRKVTPEEAAELLANRPAPPVEPVPPASLGDALAENTPPPQVYRYSQIETVGFISEDVYEGAATILDSYLQRVWFGDQDEVMIGFGAQEVAVGDQFEIFRPVERVRDPETGDTIGWATRVLGWLQVKEVHEESATATIRMSRAEIRRGDYLLPRPSRNMDIEIGPRVEIEGRVVHTPNKRLEMATTDVVYLDRGTDHGLLVGSPLEVYRPIGTAFDALRGDERALPDEVVAKLIVVEASPEAAVAVITHTRKEINRGDVFRGSDSIHWK